MSTRATHFIASYEADRSRSAVLPGEEACNSHGGRRSQGRAWTGVAVALTLSLLASVAWLSTAGAPPSVARGLPPGERAHVVQRAVANLRDACRAPGRPRDFCLEQANLVLGLPECDAACQALAREELRADMARK